MNRSRRQKHEKRAAVRTCCNVEKTCDLCDERFTSGIAVVHHNNVNNSVFVVCYCNECYVQHLNVRQNLDGTSVYGVRNMTCMHCNQEFNSDTVAMIPFDCTSEERKRADRLLNAIVVDLTGD